MPFDFSLLSKKGKKKPPMKSVSGGSTTAPPVAKSAKTHRPSVSKGQSTKAADALASMGFGKGMKVT
jgi:hypothetical protein